MKLTVYFSLLSSSRWSTPNKVIPVVLRVKLVLILECLKSRSGIFNLDQNKYQCDSSLAVSGIGLALRTQTVTVASFI